MMKKLLGLAGLCAVLLLALNSTGCDNKKGAKDGKKDGTTNLPAKKTDVTVSAEPSAWTGKPEEKGEVKLKLTRGAEAKHEVTFEVKSDSEAVKASADKVAGDKSEGVLKLEIAKEAKEGDVKVAVTAKSKDSKDSTATVTVTVKKAKGDAEPVKAKDAKQVSLSPDKASLKLKQGEKGDATFKVGGKDAKVTVKDAPKGLKVTVGDIKDGEAKVNVAVADDAKAGDHVVTIEAAAEGATAVTATLTVTVEKKK